MFWDYPLKIQCLDTLTTPNSVITTIKEFKDKKEHLDFLLGQFKKQPQDYQLKNTKYWQTAGRHYTATVNKPNFEGGYYTKAIKGSHQWKLYWSNEKDKVKNGVIIDGLFIPPFYYWYLNFCPIYDDLKKKRRFGDVWDTDLWYMQYCLICILSGKHIGGVKGRQKGFSFKHMAILYWSYCWFEGSINTVGGYMEDLVKKSWRFIEGYRKHINTYTAWKRGPQRPKSLEWYERTELKNGGFIGNDSKLVGVTFKQSPDNDVGGNQTFFNYEEPGVSPTILETLEFVRPALEKGTETTGIIIACGSVGNLEDAEGIKTIFYDPDAYNFYGMDNIWDDDGFGKKCCIFISEAYSMIGCDDLTGLSFIDEEGNSRVDIALAWINRKAEETKKSKKKWELKQLAVSQKCTSPKMAFNQRTLSRFPLDRIARTQEYIKLLEPSSSEHPKKVKIWEDDLGKIKWKIVSEEEQDVPYPVKLAEKNKEGVVLIHKFPEENPPLYTYYGGVDNVEVDDTTTSESLFSIYIVEGTTEVIYWDEEGNKKMRIEGDRIVASVTGRLSSVEETNARALLLMRMYNAFTLAEKNKPNFITYVKKKGYNYLLASEADVPIFKDINWNKDGDKDAKGIHMDSTGNKQKQADNYLIEWLNTETSTTYITLKDGEEKAIKTFYVSDSIRDYWLLEELKNEKQNTDRRDALRLAILLKSIWQTNGVKKRRVEKNENKNEDTKEKIKRSINLLGNNSTYKNKFNTKTKKRYSFL